MRRVSIFVVVAASFGIARAQDATKPAPEPEIALDVEREIDIANIVTSAAKGVTTVQEAPAIVTIITAEEIRARGWKTIGQALGTVPGWLDVEAEGNNVAVPMVRGNIQAALYLRDGVSFFDPVFNVAALNRSVPMETIKRIEVVTGPGGVLWGANSYLGIVNVITKDAEDVNGVEISGGYGDGRGDRSDARAYAMWGHSFFKNKLKVMLHASYENYGGPQYSGVDLYAASPAPQPSGPALYGASPVDTSSPRSWLLNLDGKITFGPFSLYGNVPFGQMAHSLSFSNVLVTQDASVPGSNNNVWKWYDRYAVLEYKSRFLRDRLGVNAKAYYINFVRDIDSRLYPVSNALPTGFSFQVNDLNAQRFGGTFDADFSGPWSWNRVLVGGEAFNERVNTSHITITQPDAASVPLACPLNSDGMTRQSGCPLPFIYGADRTVVGLFIADQIRPVQTLTLDGGVRYQQGFGKRSYDAQVLGSAAAVWQFLPDYHLKLNFAQGFRPPVFNNTDGNGGGVEFGGNPNLKVERSSSYQAEANARVLKNVRKVRELQLRVDYSYTILENFIILHNSQYTNAGKRGIHSVEALAKLYLNGDHAITVGYTFVQIDATDVGQLRSVPNHWVSIGMVFNIVKDLLDVNGNLNVLGAYEDPNRYVSSSFTFPTPPGSQTMVGGIARYTDLTFDQLTPVALLQLGARLRLFNDKLVFSAQAYNVLNQHFYYPDVFYDLAPTVEMRPTPAPGFSFFASVTWRPL